MAGARGLMQPATSANIKGIDVSHWQGTIDWKEVKNSGIAFAYAKASQGTTITDPMFATNVQGARAAGLPIGAYHYANPSAPYSPDQAKAEAQNFVNVMQNAGMGDFGDIMPVLDLEEPAITGSLTSDEIASWGRVFVDTVKSLTNRQVMIYTGDWFVDSTTILAVSFQIFPFGSPHGHAMVIHSHLQLAAGPNGRPGSTATKDQSQE